MPPTNVVMVLLDTLRFDYAVKNTYLRNLAEKGWWFDRMYAPSTFTYAVMCSVRSGMYPPRHGWCTWPKGGPFREEFIKTIDGFLDDEGNRIDGFLGDEGYTILSDMHTPCSNDEYLYRELLEKVMIAEQPFFLFLHCWWGHHAEKNRTSYGESLKEMVAFIEFVFARFNAFGLFENTLWIIFSDHGTRLEETQLKLREGHDTGAGQVLDYRVRVPCIIFGPKVRPDRIKSAHSLVDILPTTLDLLGISCEVPEGFFPMHGRSVLKGRQSPVYLEAQSPHSIWGNKFPNVFGATDGHVKVMVTPEGNWCYDLVEDPQEIHPCKELLKTQRVQDMLKFIEEIRGDAVD